MRLRDGGRERRGGHRLSGPRPHSRAVRGVQSGGQPEGAAVVVRSRAQAGESTKIFTLLMKRFCIVDMYGIEVEL